MLICNTINGTERLTENLKYDKLVGWKNCTLSELLTIVIESFLPKLYEKYVEFNVKFTSGYKKYQESIPESLHNRPRFIVQNMLEKMSKVTSSMISSVKVLTEGRIFEVQSESVTSDLKAKYIVDFGNINEICSCTCRGFRRDRLPCKHFFAVIDAGYRTFEQLSPLLLEHPLMTLDETLFNSQLTKPNLSPNLLYTENHEHQGNVNLLDQYPEVEVTDKTEYAPLPSRRSLFKRKKMDLIANLKNLVEKCYNIKADEQFVSNVNEQVKRLINTVTIHLEGENDELVERPVTPDKGNSQKKSREVKKQSKQNFEFKNLSFPRKRKHKYTGRVGSKAETIPSI